MSSLDVFDLLALVGLALIGVAVYLWLGLPATLAFAGTTLVVLAVTGSTLKSGASFKPRQRS